LEENKPANIASFRLEAADMTLIDSMAEMVAPLVQNW
jgi:hypothetical protein